MKDYDATEKEKDEHFTWCSKPNQEDKPNEGKFFVLIFKLDSKA